MKKKRGSVDTKRGKIPTETVEAVKGVSIVYFLQSQGYQSARIRGADVWFYAPWRQEKTPSLHINTDRNVFYDHGGTSEENGDVIRLARLLWCTGFKETVSRLQEYTGKSPKLTEPQKKEPYSYKITEWETQELQHPALLRYIDKRAILVQIAKQAGAKEIHYTSGKRRYFGIAFPNDNGGLEIRNPYGKFTTKKGISTVIPDQSSQEIIVVEGFMDYLAYLTLKKVLQNPKAWYRNFLILNSTGMRGWALEHLKRFPKVILALDNDAGGETTTRFFQERLGRGQDMRRVYKEYKDLNDYLIRFRQQHSLECQKKGTTVTQSGR